jgi:8-oxo-dGTP pyrophosphatase MutT (NUDIX family)
MNLDQLRILLQQALAQDLPGREAQLKMSPLPVDWRRFSLDAPATAKKSAVLLLFYPEASGVFFPLIKRPSYPGAHSGQVSFPGGKVEPSDPDLVFTALREAEEEIGIDASKVEVLGRLTDLYIPTSNFLVSPVLGFLNETPRFVPEAREVERIIPTAMSMIGHPQIRQRTLVPIGEGRHLETPYFALDGEVVWGATAMILSELLQLLEQNTP